MDNHDNKPNPDDRSDNVEKLQAMVEDTAQNIDKSEETMTHLGDEEKETIREKNRRREQAIDSMREEITDEYNHNQLK